MHRFALSIVALSLTACPTPTVDEGERCVLNSDCRQVHDGGFPLICVYGRCHNACSIDDDCAKPQVCRISVKPINVCLLPDELGCPTGTDRECPGPLVCGPDQICRDPCKSNRDCLQGALCTQGLCASPAEIDAGVVPPPTPAGTQPCTFTSECPVGQACQSGACQVECLGDRDCDRGFDCVQNVCTRVLATDGGLPMGFGARCEFTSDCAAGLLCGAGKTCTVECVSLRDCASSADCCTNFHCARGLACVTPIPVDGGTPTGCTSDNDCQNASLCDGAERCERGVCQPALRQRCDDGNPCTVDSCLEGPPVTCGHATTGIRPDDDHDGHAPAACGDLADDCDDTNPRVYGGAPELCDFVDNNCNGQVDEGLWRVDPSSEASFTTGDLYHGNAGAPAGRRVGNALYVAAASDATTRGTVDLWQLDVQSFSPMAGPYALGGSQTSWSSCFYQTAPFPGRRVGLGQLAFQPDGGGLVTGLAGTYAANTQMCCEASTPPIETAFATTFHGFSAAAPATLVTAPITGNGCNGGFNTYTRPIGPASAAWSEALGQYVVAWADKTRVASAHQVFFATADPSTGVTTAPRQVVQAGANVLGAEMKLGSSLGLFPVVAVSPTAVLFSWLQATPQGDQVRYAVLDTSLNQRLAGPSVLPLSNPNTRWPLRAEWTGTSFVVLFSGGTSGNIPAVLASISPTGVHEWSTQLIDSSASLGQQNPPGLRAPDQPTFALVGRGVVSAVTNGSRFTFGYAALAGDAGVLSFDYDTGRLSFERTDPALITIDERTVLAVWADDNLRRLVLRCEE